MLLILLTQGVEPEVVAQRVQAVYNNEACISSDFEQIYTSGTTGKRIEESGELTIKKPGRMRWEYTRPSRKSYVSDGTTVYWYVPADKQVTVMQLEQADQQQTQILFLMGRGDLARDFKITFTTEVDKMHEDSYMLRLVPNEEQQFDYLVLEVNPRDYYVERLLSFDPLGNVMEYRFINIHQDDVKDNFFTFEVPRGVEVVQQGVETGVQ